MRSAIALISCLLMLALVTYSILEKERHLENGKIVYLELAPVDPRSLMQGDYMALRYKIANDAHPAMARAETSSARGRSELAPGDGRIVAALGTESIASYRRLDDGSALASDEVLLRYRVRNGQVKFATNAYFFQEGTARRYEKARYGEFRVMPDGELLLTGLRDEERRQL